QRRREQTRECVVPGIRYQKDPRQSVSQHPSHRADEDKVPGDSCDYGTGLGIHFNLRAGVARTQSPISAGYHVSQGKGQWSCGEKYNLPSNSSPASDIRSFTKLHQKN
ncbi:hypothetical protein INR49_007623, partial [Caranx melampygus]